MGRIHGDVIPVIAKMLRASNFRNAATWARAPAPASTSQL
jgi:hypothetical protein